MADVRPDAEQAAPLHPLAHAVDVESDPRGAGSSEEVLQAIWHKHRAAVLDEVSLIEQAIDTLMAGERDEQLCLTARHTAHTLIGSVGTFGFIRASEAARQLELALADPSTAQALAMAELLATMRRELHQDALPRGCPQRVKPAIDRPGILVVDDDVELCQRIAAEALSREMRCDTAASPQQARELCAVRPPAIVLLDLVFPPDGVAGAYALLSELSAATPPIPVVVLTGADTFTDRVEVARRGSRAFLPKSLTPEQVIDAVEQLRAHDRLQATRVLIVDDDPAMLDVMSALLVQHDLEVSTLADPLRFWDALQETAPELLILDVDMPAINGPELCRTVRNDPRWRRLGVIFATARTDAATVAEIFDAGADDYIPKPIVGPELINRVANRLERIRLYREQAETDYLTGLDSRAKAHEGLTQLVTLADRLAEPLSVAMLDVDGFKLVNDSYGHAVGDSVLRRLGEQLRRDFRGSDVVGRWGGEEFIVGMYGMTQENGVKRLTDTLQRFRQERFTGAHETLRVSFSAGVAQYPLDGRDLTAVAHAADEALYRAKAAGRARVLAASADVPSD